MSALRARIGPSRKIGRARYQREALEALETLELIFAYEWIRMYERKRLFAVLSDDELIDVSRGLARAAKALEDVDVYDRESRYAMEGL